MALGVAAIGVLAYFYFFIKRKPVEVIQSKYETSDAIVFFAVLSLTFSFALTQLVKTNAFIYIVSFALAWIAQRYFAFISTNSLRIVTIVLLSYLLLFNKALTSTHYLPSIISLVVIFTICLWRSGPEVFAVAVLLFSTKQFFSGPYEVVDAFHSAEHFLASLELHKGFFEIFPNLGYLEEYPAYALTVVLKLFTGGIIQMSIGTARSLLWLILYLIIFTHLYRRDRLLAVLFMLVVRTDRVSLLIALAYAALSIASYQRAADTDQRPDRLGIALVSLFPLVAIGLTPSYLLFPILAFVGMMPFENYQRKQLMIIATAWTVILGIFHRQVIEYLFVYAQLSKLYDVAFSTSISTLRRWDLSLWLVLLFVAGLVVSSLVRPADSIKVKSLKFLGALLVLIKCADYGFGRIDSGPGRLVPTTISLMLVASFFSKRFNGLIALMLGIVIVSYIQFDLPRKLDASDFSLSNPHHQPVQLSASSAQIACTIGEFAAGRQVINYSSEPALTLGISNAISPPFTTPFVTLGEENQRIVISFMKAHPEAIVYLGHEFTTFDDVDIRLRVPLIFRHLALGYSYATVKGNIYAIPNTSAPDEKSAQIFFGNLDLKKSPLYFTQHAKGRFSYREIIIDCPRQEAGRYKIINEGNTLHGDFQCGINYVPEVFFLGKTKDIQREP